MVVSVSGRSGRGDVPAVARIPPMAPTGLADGLEVGRSSTEAVLRMRPTPIGSPATPVVGVLGVYSLDSVKPHKKSVKFLSLVYELFGFRLWRLA